MKFLSYLRGALLGASLTGLGLGVLFLGLTLAGLRLRGDITVELDSGIEEALWSLLALPAALVFLTLLAAPLVYVFLLLTRYVRRRLSRP